jgi:hypothetical protein
MSKLSIDLCTGDYDPIVSNETLTAVSIGCRQTLVNLGEIGKMIEVIKVTFTTFPLGKTDDPTGPVFKIIFCDPLGKKCSYETDFRFIGTEVFNPEVTADEISEHLCKELPRFIEEHLESCASKINGATNQLAKLRNLA